jgi:F-type H+-transporting ATPase subunit gamma
MSVNIMAGAKEIRTKIASIKKTQKITRAMEMVAASKMRKTQDRMKTSRPYATKIEEVVRHLSRASSEYRHEFLQNREVKNVGVIIVTSDRGLCGGLNANLLRMTVNQLREWQNDGLTPKMAIFGRKGQAFFRRVGGNVLATHDHFGDSPNLSDVIGVVQAMLDAYKDGQIDALYIAYNEFVNTMTQKPVLNRLLPLPETDDVKLKKHWDYIYEPDAKELLDQLLIRFIEIEVYQALVENIACEQAAKMVAMKSATDNAGELIKEFQLAYNKARQAAITQELAEIVGGAAAL